MRGIVADLGHMAVLAYMGNFPYPGSEFQTPGEQVEDWLRVSEQIQNWKKFQPKDQAGIDELSSKVRELLEHLDVAAGPELREGRLKNLSGGTTEFESFELRIKQMEILLDQYENDKYATSNPQDILAWEKLKRSPEYLQKAAINTLHSVTEIPGFKFKGIDPNNMSPGDQQYVDSKLRSLELWFSQWKQNPKSGMGGYLAEKLLGGAEQLGPHIDESPLEPNPEAARIIAEISARAGEENSNDLLWEKFGLSEEWTPTSFQHDYKKAAKKAIKAAKKELGFDIAAFAKENRALDKLERAAKALDKKHKPEYVALMKKRLALQMQHKQGLINDIEYNREKEILKDHLAIQANDARQREIELEQHRSNLRVKVEAARQSLHQSLTQANAETAAQPETVAAVLGRLDQPMWRDMSTDSPATNNEGDITPQAQQDFDRLQAARQEHRRGGGGPAGLRERPLLVHVKEIKGTVSRVLGWLHRDLLEGPEGVMLKEVNWEAEFLFRARANEEANSIILDRDTNGAVAVHEFGHHLEFRNKRVKARILDLYNERTEGIKAEWIEGYEPHERFKQPKTKGKRFFKDYASKFYPNIKGEQGDTELLSLGLEALENEDEFRQLLRNDPEHLAIILATIRGY